jgi:hypothetical protein
MEVLAALLAGQGRSAESEVVRRRAEADEAKADPGSADT